MDADGRDPPGQASRHGHAPPGLINGRLELPVPAARRAGQGCCPRGEAQPAGGPPGFSFTSWAVLPAPVRLCRMRTLVLVRHGESVWNSEGLFTGWVDVGLSPKGVDEAVNCGRLLDEAGVRPDLLHTPVLTRAIQTAHL